MEECGVRGEVDPNLHLVVNELEDELDDQAGDELEHELKLGGKHQRGRVAGSVEARFQSTDIRMVSLISSQLCQVWSNNVNHSKPNFLQCLNGSHQMHKFVLWKCQDLFIWTGQAGLYLDWVALQVHGSGLFCCFLPDWDVTTLTSGGNQNPADITANVTTGQWPQFWRLFQDFFLAFWQRSEERTMLTRQLISNVFILQSVFSFNNTLKIIILTE